MKENEKKMVVRVYDVIKKVCCTRATELFLYIDVLSFGLWIFYGGIRT